jgi:hypothetical protein
MDFKDLKPGMLLGLTNRTHAFLYFIRHVYTESVVFEEHVLPNRESVYIIAMNRINKQTWNNDRLDYMNARPADDRFFRGFVAAVFKSSEIREE